MKAKFRFLVMLFLLTTNSYALEPAYNKSRKLTGGFLKHRLERTEGNTKRNPFQQKIGFQKQAVILKSVQAIKQRLDSYSSMTLDEITGQWREDEKVEFIYNPNWKVIQEVEYNWDETTNKLVNDSKVEYIYDTNGYVTQVLYSSLDVITSKFTIDIKFQHNYDIKGNLTQEIFFRLDETTNQLYTYRKHEYTYDSSGNRTQEINSRWNETTSQLEVSTKYEYTYNNNGQEIKSLGFNWSIATKQWIQHEKTETTYDSKGYAILKLESNWDEISTKEEFTYDTRGNLTQNANFSFTSNQWVPWYKQVYTFDDQGNNTQYINYNSWDSLTSEWKDIWKDENTFNNNYTTNDLILPHDLFDDEGGLFSHMITEIKEYEWNNNTKAWILDYKISLTYSAQNVTSIKSMDTELSSVYPNPFSEFLAFSIPGSYSQITFELFDLQGRKLLSKIISSNEKVNMERFRSGMYLYKLNMDGKVQSGKLVKE